MCSVQWSLFCSYIYIYITYYILHMYSQFVQDIFQCNWINGSFRRIPKCEACIRVHIHTVQKYNFYGQWTKWIHAFQLQNEWMNWNVPKSFFPPSSRTNACRICSKFSWEWSMDGWTWTWPDPLPLSTVVYSATYMMRETSNIPLYGLQGSQ